VAPIALTKAQTAATKAAFLPRKSNLEGKPLNSYLPSKRVDLHFFQWAMILFS
jgi:hypothetical protein